MTSRTFLIDGAGKDAGLAAQSQPFRPRVLLLMALTVGLAGLALRLFVMVTSLGATDSDEAIIGLIGLRATHGAIDVMFWGQAYGGTVESFLVAPLFALFGPSVLVERLLLLVISSGAAVLTWRVGRRLIGQRAGVVAALVFWTMSSYFVWWSTKINIYYGALCLALVVHLMVLRLRDDEAPRWWPAVFGLAAGAAAWSNPQTMYLLIPLVLIEARALIRHYRMVLASVPFALLGFLPWIVYSMRNGWNTLHVPGVDVYLPYAERVALFYRELPILVGVRVPLNNQWLLPTGALWALGLSAAAGLVWALYRNVPGVRVLTAVILAYSLFFGLSPQVGQPGASVQPRYLLFVTPAVALCAASVATRLRLKALPIGAMVLLALTVAASTAGLVVMERKDLTLVSAGPEARVPADVTDAVDLLLEHDVRGAYSFYWLAYRVTFEAGEEVIVVPAFAHISRFKPYADFVEQGPPAPVLALRDSPQVAALEGRLAALGVPYARFDRGQFTILIPSRHVARDDYAAAFREAGVFA